MTTRLEHATVITPRGDGVVVLPDHTIEFDGPRISALCPTGRAVGDSELREPDSPATVSSDIPHSAWSSLAVASIPHSAATTSNASNLLIIPGLVNTHHHLFQSLTRCHPRAQNAGLFNWLIAQYPIWRHMDYESLKLAATISMAEMLLGGATTTSDHQYLFPRDSGVKIEAVLEAADSLGFRIHVCRGSMTLGESKGGLPPDACCEDDATVLADYSRVLDRFHDPRPFAMHRIDLAPCTPFNATPELFRDTVTIARQRGVLLHTHIAETRDEEAFCIERYGCRPIQFLRDRDWLGPDVYLAHAVHLSDAEIDLIAQTKTGIAHCPVSNMRLASGIAPITRLMQRGAKVGIGVDGSASNDGGHALHAARQAMLLQRVLGGPDAMTPAQALCLATVGGAAVLNRPELGRIEVGAAADVVCFRRDDIAFAGAVEQDPLAALLLCHAGRPERVFINGQSVVHEGRITGIDLPATIERFNALVRARWR